MNELPVKSTSENVDVPHGTNPVLIKYQKRRPHWPRIRRVKIKGKVLWAIDKRPIWKTKPFEYRSSKDRAMERAHELKVEFHNLGTEGLNFPSELRLQALKAMEILKPIGVNLVTAAEFYAAHTKEAERLSTSVGMEIAIQEWVLRKEREEKRGEASHATFKEIRRMGELFKAQWPLRKVETITVKEVSEWIDELPHTTQTRANIRTKLSQFFNFCRLREWRKDNPCDLVEITALREAEVSILSVLQCEKVLETTRKQASSVLPYLLISLFAGLRPGEVRGLSWDRIHWDTGEIEVRAETSKTRQTRFVPMEPDLVCILKPLSGAGKVTKKGFDGRWNTLRASLGYQVGKAREGDPWPPDVLRHTFGTYWLAKYQNRAKLAEIMGNSPSVIRKHYRRAVSAETAEAFWKLLTSFQD